MSKNDELNQWEASFWIVLIIIVIAGLKYHEDIINFENYLKNYILFWIIAFFIVVLIFLAILLFTHISIKSGKFVSSRINAKQKSKQDRINFIRSETDETEDLLLKEIPIDEKILTNEIGRLRKKVKLYRPDKELQHFIPKLEKRLAKATASLEKVRNKRLLKETNEEKWKSQRLDEQEINLDEEQKDNREKSEMPAPQNYRETKIIEEQKAYITDDLDLSDRNFLLSKGFIWHTQNNLDGKQRAYLVFNDKYESPNHIICTKEIVDFLKKFTDDIKTFRTVMPDVVFTCNDKSYAIEVETGTIIRDKKKMQNKIDLLNKNYKNNWFFFVTNRNMEKEYLKYGKVTTKRNIKIKIRQIFNNSKK